MFSKIVPPPLTVEQRAALEAFAAAHGGEHWREALADCWVSCTEPMEHKAALRQVRNTYGPTWLFDVYAWGWTPEPAPWVRAVWVDGKAEPAPEGSARWSAPFDPPAYGAEVLVKVNGLGVAEVTGYFVQDGWLGVVVKLRSPPPWYEKQNGGNVPGHSFGPEVEPIVPPPVFTLDTEDACEVEAEGFTVRASVQPDHDMKPPWEAHDGHGDVSDWRPALSKRPGERELCRDRDSCRFYDWAGAVKIARRDGWGTEDGQQEAETARNYAARAAEADYKRLRDWCLDRWSWVGVVLEVERAGVVLGGASLWGIESDAGDYLNTVAAELLPEALQSARAKLVELAA